MNLHPIKGTHQEKARQTPLKQEYCSHVKTYSTQICDLPYLSQWAGTGSLELAEIPGSYVRTAAGETPAAPTCVLREMKQNILVKND